LVIWKNIMNMVEYIIFNLLFVAIFVFQNNLQKQTRLSTYE
jgi:hypothetical protein